MRIKPLFIAAAVIEAGAGLALLVSPELAASILIGAPFNTPADSIVGRVAGAALLALATACWRGRNDGLSSSASGLLSGLLLYNFVAALLLAYAGLGLRMFSVALWPVVALHAVMAIWCVACIAIERKH